MVVPTRVLIKTDWVEQLTGVLTRCLLGQLVLVLSPDPPGQLEEGLEVRVTFHVTRSVGGL